MPTLLLVEDDPVIRGALVRALSDAGHVARTAGTALDALRDITEAPPDLVILDLGLPDLDGADALRMLRGVCEVPVIIATARSDETSMVRLLRAGADDYVTKPFSSAQLLARVDAVLRRSGAAARIAGAEAPPEEPPIEVGELVVDPSRRTATLDGSALELTRKEFDLLAYLAVRAGKVVTRREIVEAVWQQQYLGAEQTIDVHVSWLRRKLGETAAAPRFLRTVRGVGLMLVQP